MGLAPALLSRANAQVQDLAPTASRIYPGADGRLVYVADEQGNSIHDASHAGYRGGGVGIPYRAGSRNHLAGSRRQHAAHPGCDRSRVGASTRRGWPARRRAPAIRLLPDGDPVRIQASGVVLRGEGMGDTGTVLIGTGTGRVEGAGPGAGGPGGQGTLVTIAGASGATARENTRQAVADDYVPVGARSFRVASARGFRAGDTVIVRRIGNQEWIDAVGMNGESPQSRWRPFNIEWDRVVVDVQGNTITIDAPLTCAIDRRWGGGDIATYDDAGRIEQVGVENLRAVSEFDPSVRTTEYGNMDRQNYVAEEYYADENHYRNFVVFDNVKNGWVRNAAALHFVNSMVGTQRGAKWITVQDCVSRAPVSRRLGARRFTFALRGQLALVQRCHSDEGRHSFMTGQPTGSGNVFLDCRATSPFSSSEPHEQWATGNLYDNVQAPLTARFWKNITIGWAGANTVFWNCEGDFLVQKPPTAQNFSFGHLGVNAVIFNIPLQDTTKDNGHIESLGRHVTPRSLYLTQLRERLGDAAVRQVALASQIG